MKHRYFTMVALHYVILNLSYFSVSKKAAASIYCTGKFSGMNGSKFRMQDTAAAIAFRKWKA